MLIIDGSQGEGGGQILRSSLSLSLITQRPFCIENIRANRRKPGLMRQHLTAVRAATSIGCAETEGATMRSKRLIFKPRKIRGGHYSFEIGTAGSTPLVLQTVLPALMMAQQPSVVTLTGGTHNLWAPTFDFLQTTYLPLINQMGPKISATLSRHGFYPVGGGKFEVTITPSPKLQPLILGHRKELNTLEATAVVCKLPEHIAQRELDICSHKLSIPNEHSHLLSINNGKSPGNFIFVTVNSTLEPGPDPQLDYVPEITELFAGVGTKGKRAELVAKEVIEETRNYLQSHVPVGTHLADQLMLPMALADGQNIFSTLPLTRHSKTNIAVIQNFLDTPIEVIEENRAVEVRIG